MSSSPKCARANVPDAGGSPQADRSECPLHPGQPLGHGCSLRMVKSEALDKDRPAHPPKEVERLFSLSKRELAAERRASKKARRGLPPQVSWERIPIPAGRSIF